MMKLRSPTERTPARGGRSSRRAAPRVAALRVAAVAAGAAVLLAGCGGGTGGNGGSSAPGVTHPVATDSPSSTGARPLPAPQPLADPSTRPGAPTAATGHATPACGNALRLATWSNSRLAMLTITVPAAEGDPSSVTAEVGAGAGGVLLFGSSAPSGLGAELAALKAHAPESFGPLVMTDEEGGGIQRMANLVGSLPWPSWMGANWSAAQIRQATALVAARMAAAGVTMDLAPVADVDGTNAPPSATDPDGWRSFSGNGAVAASDTIAYMQGMISGGVIPVLKHFPGLGGSSYNSDDGPASTLPWPTEQTVGVPPFTAAIAAGAPAIMISNNTVPGLATDPAGLSPTVITGELKGRLGFHGLVITDALDAKAVSAAGFDVPQAAVQALRAGADMVMFGLGPNVGAQTSATAAAIVSAVNGGSLARSRLIDAAGAVLAVRHIDLCHS
ncbi:glycoside hydrolase family 3 N-terminal domain-containing protein [Streptacidiphilus sp. EB129]|uniref:glycoside hydrolase family 3 N-terminal domain-containing protein n=1 Tax=Streptacidiphilus sp. EB129 TaxID=3156262 RepID=UPI003514F53B